MKYCRECLYPDTKPDLWFDDTGLCAACIAFNKRKETNWAAKEIEFKEIVFAIKQQSFPYDCIVPVSGGKDSTYQVIKAKEYGLKVLAVNARTDSLSNLGRKNLDNISNLGVDCVELSLDHTSRKKCAKYALVEIGDVSYVEHVSIFTIPIHMARKFSVPLILWGECPQNEYGGPAAAQGARNLDQRWLSEFGGLNGLRVSDLIDQGILPEEKSYFYRYPTGDGLKNPTGLFLGAFFEWDGYQNAVMAKEYGFTWSDRPVEGIGYRYENLDNYQTGLRDYLKYAKYGFGRATDLLCNHIRRKRIDRQEAIDFCRTWDGQFPATYLRRPLESILLEIDCTLEEYHQVVERFYNKELFEYLGEGRLKPKFVVC